MTSEMELLSIVVLKEKAEDVVYHLLRLGIFHPVDIRHIEEELRDLSPFQIDKEYSQWDELDAKLKQDLRKLNIDIIPRKDIKTFSPEEAKVVLASLEENMAPFLEEKEELTVELETKKSILSQIKSYPLFSLKRESVYSFLEVSLGRIDERNIPALERSLKGIPHIFYPFKKEGDNVSALFIGLRRDRVFIERVLKDMSWLRIEYPKEPETLSHDVEEKLFIQIEGVKKRIQEIELKMKNVGESFKEELSSVQSFIILKKSLLDAKRFSCTTEKTVLLSGWVPLDEKENIVEEIKKIDSLSYVEARDAEDLDIPREEIPVKLKHTAFFKPFELLINSYGIPRYGSIDPTIFVAISFLLMFGAMFGDLGHGLVLSLASLFLRRSRNEKVRQASALILYCGISSAVFGVMYGSFFGLEFPSLWIKPMDDILGIFKISILFGIIFITLGILINVINAFRDRDYVKAVFDKAGLIGGVIYWSGIGIITKMFVSKGRVSAVFIGLISAGVIILLMRPVIEFFFKREKGSLLAGLAEAIVDILEIGMGYLANTISFIRVAAFSLAHVGLFLAIFELSRIINSSAGQYIAYAVVVLGNILIILLEGLVVSIQSLRLNYYEFFSKFFIAGKYSYKPMSI
jgi:V/A-type H+-transporting ATPase subunit I